MIERRRYPRVEEAVNVEVVRGPEQIACSTVDISCGGALCWVPQAMPLMTKVAVAVALPTRLIHCQGAVVRCEPSHGRYRAAILFLDVKREDHRAIAEFVLDAMLKRSNGHRRR